MDARSKKSILEMARGGFLERVDYEMARIVDNILDANTKATAKRKLTITMELQPDDDRESITARFTAKSTLTPTNPVQTMLYVSGSDSTGEVQISEMAPQIPGQLGLDSSEQETPPMLRLIKIG